MVEAWPEVILYEYTLNDADPQLTAHLLHLRTFKVSRYTYYLLHHGDPLLSEFW